VEHQGMTAKELAEELIRLLVARQNSCGGDIIIQASTLEALLRSALQPKIELDSRYPKCLYSDSEPPRLVASAEEEAALGEGWTAQPQGVVE
jgi:hypothetical protein